MSPILVRLALVVAASQVSVAMACETYTLDGWLADVAAVDATLEAVQLDAAGEQLAAVADQLLCLQVAAPPQVFARFAVQRATVAFFGQDEMGALRWSRAAQFADGDVAWPSIVAEGHPVRSLSEDTGPPLWGGPDGGFAIDRRGAVLANGLFIARPRLPSEVPMLVQVFDRRGDWVQGHWQDGPLFPEALLDADTDPRVAPDWVVTGAPGLGEGTAVSVAPVDDDPGPIGDSFSEPTAPVDDRPIEERAREVWERAVWIADANPSVGRGKIHDFLDEFGDSGIPEVADARRWVAAHPLAEAEPELAVVEAELEAGREPRDRRQRRRSPREPRERQASEPGDAPVVKPEPPVEQPEPSLVAEPQPLVVAQPELSPVMVIEPSEAANTEQFLVQVQEPVESLVATVVAQTLRGASPEVRITTTRDVVIDTGSLEGEAVCVSEKAKCKESVPLGDQTRFRLSGSPGLHAVYLTVDGSSGSSTHTAWYWLDTKAPKLGSIAVVPDAEGWTILAADLRDSHSRVASWIVGQATRQADDDCSDVLVQGVEPAVWIARDQVSWNALMFCAVDEAGLMSDPIKVQLDYDAIGTLVPAEAGPVAWLSALATLEPLVTDEPVCRSDRPSCRRYRESSEVLPHSLSETPNLQSAYTFSGREYAPEIAVQHAVVDTRPPSDGTLVTHQSDEALVVGWPGAHDRETRISRYRLVGTLLAVPADCMSGPALYEGAALWTTLPQGGWHLRACAIDLVGNVSSGATAVVRD
jgi:hypothetical protein